MRRVKTYDKERFTVNLARLKRGGEKFEVVIDSEKAFDLRQGKDTNIEDVIINKKIYSDAKKGFLASEAKIKELFGTDDVLEVAKIVVKEGELQLTEEHRRKLNEEKRKRIIDLIHKNGVDPKTHLPHPPQRIENAFEEAKVHIDEHKRAEDQIQEILKKLREVLPIKFEVAEVAIKIPSAYAAKSYSAVKNSARILSESWQNDGSWICTVEIPAGLQEEFFEKLNSLTRGEIEIKRVGSK